MLDRRCQTGRHLLGFFVFWLRQSRTRPIPDAFNETERERFHNLLKVAESSSFEGERQNALAAATRLAAKFGMSLREAAAAGSAPPPPPPREPPGEDRHGSAWQAEFARFVHLSDYQVQLDKARREAALREAVRRGLDAEERQAAARQANRRVRSSRARMDPQRHAHTLLAETSLRFREIAEITGLSVYQVVGMKLKMRASATGAAWFEGAGQPAP